VVYALGLGDLAGAVVLVVHAHPDDEVFATGAATIAAKTAGATVHLRVFTGGEGRDSELTEAGLTEARLRKEPQLSTSTLLLGIDTWDYLTEPGQWTDTPHAPERTIAGADPSALAAAVVTAIDILRPDVLLTVGPDGLTGHPDHIACHNAVASALETAAHRPRIVLGAILDQRVVRSANQTARRITDGPVGSGRVAGVSIGSEVITVTGPPVTEVRRKRALDAYVPGLGTSETTELDPGLVGAGDSVLLRFVLDTAGWNRDDFVRLPGGRGSPQVTQ
jgi:LmbE family N-acetylglucosaminyl deacetylase